MSDGFDCDYIVVGSGAGGGTLAARLAEEGMHVILLEAGGDPRSEVGIDRFPGDYDIPAFHPFASEHPAMAWNMFVEHFADATQAARDPKRVPGKGVLYPRAGTLGGCTAHNAMIFLTAQACDWDLIAHLSGDPGWGSASMARYQERVEACRHRPVWRWLARLGITPTGHGWRGWLPIEVGKPREALADTKLRHLLEVAGIAAARRITGLRASIERLFQGALDPNDRRTNGAEGLCYAPLANDGHRRTGARERVLSVAKRYPERLRVELNALVTRVLFDADGGAIGVEYRSGRRLYRAAPNPAVADGALRTLRARREVILSGGAFNTPQLLMLSGIGPRAELERHGITVRVDLPGVGTNLQDRYEVCVQSKLAHTWESLEQVRYEADDPVGLMWAQKRTGIYISNGAALAFKRKSDPALDEADLFIFALLGNFKGYFPGYSKALATGPDVISWAILKARTDNRAGTVRLRSADPRDPPLVQFHYFEEGSDHAGRDLRAVAQGVAFVREATAPLKRKGLIEGELDPGEDIRGPALDDWVRDHAWGHHASCSCPIGKLSDGGVLDGRLRVHGVNRLRIVDASIFPRIPGYFIVSAVYMAAERAADLILEQPVCARRSASA
ncbi:GMC family oxidoreductase [Sphingomonas sp. BIUV-7]|uniref:GMC family oxidoreductase n=1 Tax=Sphingomonas natans TaxID=3063330 RepID=A0ABT8YCG6_9SPHN|nr:GMC family oxidoreductase [Sphingomonas sp. BIUV-7]MDO6416045.1 GMC family oxidoreductase [Sphingomonas sp. BIUV-7]